MPWNACKHLKHPHKSLSTSIKVYWSPINVLKPRNCSKPLDSPWNALESLENPFETFVDLPWPKLYRSAMKTLVNHLKLFKMLHHLKCYVIYVPANFHTACLLRLLSWEVRRGLTLCYDPSPTPKIPAYKIGSAVYESIRIR